MENHDMALSGIRFVYSGTGDFPFVEGLARKYRKEAQQPVLDSKSHRKDAPK